MSCVAAAYVALAVEAWVLIAALVFREGYRRLPDADWDGVLWTYRSERQLRRRNVFEIGIALCVFVVLWGAVMGLGSWLTGNGVF